MVDWRAVGPEHVHETEPATDAERLVEAERRSRMAEMAQRAFDRAHPQAWWIR